MQSIADHFTHASELAQLLLSSCHVVSHAQLACRLQLEVERLAYAVEDLGIWLGSKHTTHWKTGNMVGK